MHETEKVLGVILVSSDQTAEVMQPGEQAFQLLAPLVATQFLAILGGRPHPVISVRCDQVDATLGQLLVQRIAVVDQITDQPRRLLDLSGTIPFLAANAG